MSGVFYINTMQTLKIFLINLFMTGEESSTSINGGKFRDTTFIQCDGYTFEFKQHDINLKQTNFYNKSVNTTTVIVKNITDDEIDDILEIIDDICWLLSLAQQSFVYRRGYRTDIKNENRSCLGISVGSLRNIIDNRGHSIRNFIEQTYPTFKNIRDNRQLPVVIGYLCEANRVSLAFEISLISHYVAIENLKHTFALTKGFQQKRGESKYHHPDYPPLNDPPLDIENYFPPKSKQKQFIHKKFGKCGSKEMMLRMFEDIGFDRNNTFVTKALNDRNTLIHEGVLFPFSHENYSEQAHENLKVVSNLIRLYLLKILNYKGIYHLYEDRIGMTGSID